MLSHRTIFITAATALFYVLHLSPVLAIETKAKHAILIDYTTSAVLLEKDAYAPMKPASMTKLMTSYIVFQHLKKGIFTLEDTFRVSETAWRKGGSKTFVKQGDLVTIETLLNGMIVQSGNDATIVLAEGIAGSEENFAKLMNATAKTLGMNHSHFKNATGWPDEEHFMSAYDIALLCARLIKDFPEYYHYFAEKEYSYNGIMQRNRNFLLWKKEGIDGLKTGHTQEAGYGIAISGEEDHRRLIVVVGGLNSEKERASEAEKLFDYGMHYFVNKPLLKKGQAVLQAPVWLGKKRTLPLIVDQDVYATIPKLHDGKDIVLEINYTDPIAAPVTEGKEIGQLMIKSDQATTTSYPLYTGETVKKTGWFGAALQKLGYLVGK